MRLYNTIKNKAYWLVDQINIEGKSEEDYKVEFTKLLKEYEEQKIEYLSLLMEEHFENWLLSKGFRKISVIHEYTKSLEEEQLIESELKFHALSEGLMTDKEFADAYGYEDIENYRSIMIELGGQNTCVQHSWLKVTK